MAKQDVIDAINSTIVENGIKGITADSLRNLLIMMTENAGEGGSGSGDGALRIIVPETILLGLTIAEAGELSPSSWAALRLELEAERGLDLSEYEVAVNASFAHNANVAQQILEKARTGKGVSVVLDQTPYSQAFFSIQSQIVPEMGGSIESFAVSLVQPAGLMLQYAKYIPEGEPIIGVGETFACILTPAGTINSGDMGVPGYPPYIIITLNLDGSLLFEMIGTDTESGS